MSSGRKKIAVLFPGQGSQFVGMGREFLEDDPDAAALMDLAESVSGFPLGRLCLEGPMEELTRAVHLQPAITAVNLICWQALAAAGVRPDCAAGHSLGEYSALCAAGVLDPADTLRLVTERGRLMEREGAKHPGGMRAVLGLTLDEVHGIMAGYSGEGVVTVGNHNSPKQVVISGETAALDAVSALVAEQGARVIPLAVSIANHSSLVAGAVADFIGVIETIDFRPPSMPVFFNLTAWEEGNPEVIRGIMARQIASMVRWLETIEALMARDVRIFIEVGPKKVLSGLLKKILPRDYQHQSFQVSSPETLARVLDRI